MDKAIRFVGHLIAYLLIGALFAGALAFFLGALRALAQAVIG